MRTNILKIGLQSLVLVFLMGLFACEGDLGPTGSAGPTGPVGPPGLNGQDGADGQNGAENCIDCHGNNQLITAKMFQWENSVHALGGHYTRNTRGCEVCHTSQGFLQVAGTGGQAAPEPVTDPLPQNCYTCHQIHQTYTSADWALTTSDPVTFWVGGETADIGSGNLCLNCHQVRDREPALPEPGSTDVLTITSPYYGPHYGSQGTLFTGNGAFEIGEGYENSFHSRILTDKGCIQCHMAEVTGGRAAGGHTFRVETEDGDLNFNGCIECHTEGPEIIQLLVDATQADIEGLLEELATALKGIGILSSSERAVPGDWPATQVGALWNYQFVKEDRSGGVHNYLYAKALLENSIAAL